MDKYEDYYEARRQITEILEKDLIGPVTEDEWLSVRPSRYYVAGKLYPQVQPRPDDENPAEDGESLRIADNPLQDSDASLPLSGQTRPSSMALTFCVDPAAAELKFSVRFARYAERKDDEVPEAWQHLLPEDEKRRQSARFWERKSEELEIDVPVQDSGTQLIPVSDNLVLRVFFRTSGTGRIITTALVNTAQARAGSQRDELCIFQPQFKIKVKTPNLPQPFLPLERTHRRQTEEQEDLEYLYGSSAAYANGHGCAPKWDRASHPQWICSQIMPWHDVPQMRPAGSGGHALSMKFLAEGSSEEVLSELEAFRDAYAAWVADLPNRAAHEKRGQRHAAVKHIQACEAALKRISAGIARLAEDTNGAVFKAFQLANEAMLMQREQTLKRNKRPFDPVQDARWYPFQLAFLLYEITSFADPTAASDNATPDREVADLLWFPTGGGKTEAYLGISAFVIFLRRLRDPDSDGVTVMMRYTMRLLTLQQFERASILIAACELLRQKYCLGGSEISIGLWVGQSLTPNKLDEARKNLKRGVSAALPEGDPAQLRVCPWCGEELSRSDDYHVDMKRTRMLIHCSNPECPFYGTENGLPVHVVDEAIYAHLPTFIVATIDKFAQMPLREEPAALFGVGSEHRPPELIIQDELHLIAGQLGTITGLYEPAISWACKDETGTGAKIIASTATIRGAGDQILSLFGRSHTQFPPPGLDANDLYFAAPASPESRPTRRYLGIMGCDAENSTVLVHVLAAMLFATRYLATLGFSDEVVDSFWTLTGYFNTIRELGQSAGQIMDEVQDRFRYLARTKFAAVYPGVEVRPYKSVRELTSRMGSSDIREVLQSISTRSYTSGTKNKDVYDFLVATNMLSVGVDIARLGTMIVAGQPKSNAEYIQATSRIGRSTPGLVVTVYYPMRSRDRSHYEQFQTYHSALYRHVEPVSLTPFSDRARGRALHALFVTLCRYADPDLLGQEQAHNFTPDLPVVEEARAYLEDYVRQTDPRELAGLREDIEQIISYWEQQAAEKDALAYIDYRDEKNGLFSTQNRSHDFFVMSSMRNVDADVGVFIYKGDADA
ncbi:MAG: DNA helicase [Clostridia bacterium]|nr:DNA helicase [Clostridia bacterium]